MWLDKWEQSAWAFWACYKNDTPEMRKLISSPEWIYAYCKFVNDRHEIKNKISPKDYERIKKCDSNMEIFTDIYDNQYIMGIWENMVCINHCQTYASTPINNVSYSSGNWENHLANQMASMLANQLDQEIMDSLISINDNSKNKK